MKPGKLYFLLTLITIIGCKEKKPSEPVEPEAPVVKIISPQNNSAVYNLTNIFIEVTDDNNIVSVDVFIDGFGSEKKAFPWEKNIYKFIWNTPQTEDSSYHSIYALAQDEDGNFGRSDSIVVLVYKFKSPSDLIFTQLSENEIRLEWMDNSSKEKGFSIERRKEHKGFSEIARTGKNNTWYTDNTVVTDEDYYYRIRGFSDSLYTGYSDTLNISFIQSLHSFKIIEEHNDAVLTCDFTPDGERLATGSADRTIKLWNPNDGNLLKTLTGQGSSVNILSFTPDGSNIASGGGNGMITIWDINTEEVLRSTIGRDKHKGDIYGIDISSDASKLISAGSDRQIKMWNFNSVQIDFTIDFFSDDPWTKGLPILNIKFTPDDENLAVCFNDGVYILRPSPNENIFWPPVHVYHRYPDVASIYCMDYSFDENFLAGSYDNGKVFIWNTKEPTDRYYIVTHYLNDVFTTAFSPDGEYILSGGSNEIIYLAKLKTKKIIHTVSPNLGVIHSVKYSPTDDRAVSCHEYGMVFWDVSYEWRELN
ncbi:Ig-like domain-containing protein [Bacteroidota bacterium]